MTWTYSQVATALSALAPPISDPASAADALNAQTTSLTEPAHAVAVADVHGVLMLALTGDWLRIENLASQTFSGGWPSSPVAEDMAIGAAKLAVVLANSQVTAIMPKDWAGFLQNIQALVTAGVVSAASQTAIEALAIMSVPVWSPPLTPGDIQTAEAFG